jgi:hypothetical protein
VLRAVLPVYSGLEAPPRCWWFVRPASWIAVRARDAGAPATIVSHWLVRMLLANPTLVTAQLATRVGHPPIRSG